MDISFLFYFLISAGISEREAERIRENFTIAEVKCFITTDTAEQKYWIGCLKTMNQCSRIAAKHSSAAFNYNQGKFVLFLSILLYVFYRDRRMCVPRLVLPCVLKVSFLHADQMTREYYYSLLFKSPVLEDFDCCTHDDEDNGMIIMMMKTTIMMMEKTIMTL